MKNTHLTFQTSIWFFCLSLLALALFSKPLSASNDIFVSTSWLQQNQEKVVLIDMSEKSQYQKFHIEGAIWVDYAWLIKPQAGLSLSGGEHYMANLLSQLGISNTTHVVIYDDIGGLEASRLYWELDKLNHQKMNILDGGIVSWVLLGNKVTQDLPKLPTKTAYSVPNKTLTNELTADKDEVIAAIKDPKTLLIDTRTLEEFVGNPKVSRSGHIPSALWFNWSDAINTRKGFALHDRTVLINTLADAGADDMNQSIILYCNTAHRAAHTYAMLKDIGYQNVKLYDGSMQEYGIDKSLSLAISTDKTTKP